MTNVHTLAVGSDMRKAVNAALHTKYESGKWKKWFVETAKRVSKEVDEDSNVCACSCVNVCVSVSLSVCVCVCVFVHL